MKPETYQYLCRYLLERSGLYIGPGKEYLLQTRLSAVAKMHQMTDLDLMVQEMRYGAQKEEIASDVIEAMTTNETLFFRDDSPFTALAETVLPALIKARRKTRKLRIWSAACSSGQEAYSIAMTIFEHFPELRFGWELEIVGTDLSEDILKCADEGLYYKFEVQRGLPDPLLNKYFTQEGSKWRVNEKLRSFCTWKPMNLLNSFSHLGQFDIIFCRNVLIYFETQTKADILRRIDQLLPADGWLVLGGAETTMGISDCFIRQQDVDSSMFRPQRSASLASPLVS